MKISDTLFTYTHMPTMKYIVNVEYSHVYLFLIRRVAVPDSRYDFLCEYWKPPSCVPAYLHIVDIAGLVKGAHEGKVSYSLFDISNEIFLFRCRD